MKKTLIIFFSLSMFILVGCDSLFNFDLPLGLEMDQGYDVQFVNSGIQFFHTIEFLDSTGNEVGVCETTLDSTSSSPVSTVVNLDMANVATAVLHFYFESADISISVANMNLITSIIQEVGGNMVFALAINPLDLFLDGEACFTLWKRGNMNVPFDQDSSKVEIPIGDILCLSLEDLGISF